MTTKKDTHKTQKGVPLVVTKEMQEALMTVIVPPKIKRTADIIEKDVGKGVSRPLGKVMEEAGYSKSFSRHPHRVLNSKSFREILEKKLPYSKLSGIHDRLLNDTHVMTMTFPSEMADDIGMIVEKMNGNLVTTKQTDKGIIAYIAVLNTDMVFKSLGLAYDVLGLKAPVKTESTTIDLVALFKSAMESRNKLDE